MPRLLQVALLLLCAGAFAEPASVTLVGNFQSVVGCATAPDPDCAATAMIPGADGVWRLALELPAGTWSHRPASDGVPLDAPFRTFTLSSAAKVRFYFDPRSAHWASEQDAAIATAVGSFQTHLGCAAWAPDCLRSWLQDRGGDEQHSFVTQALPAGTWSTRSSPGRGPTGWTASAST